MTELIGVVVGALIVLISTGLNQAYWNRKRDKQQVVEEKMKEIDTLSLLNNKINEILQKRNILADQYANFNSFDDCMITIDDYVYLQSFCNQNHFYLPRYIIEEFFKEISHRQVVLSPDDINRIGAYTYSGGRFILETFSEDIIKCIEDRKIELKQLQRHKVSYFHS